jgi:F0F1-type ATP synthase membrane subunit b/b'
MMNSRLITRGGVATQGAASSAPTAVIPKTAGKMPALQNSVGARVLCAAALFTLLAAPVFAQETADATTTTTGWVFRWLNFAIVFGVIVWAFAKAGPYFRKHSEEIAQKIAEGTRAREAAENQRRTVQEKLSHLDEEVARLRVDAKRAAEAEAQRLRAMAKADAQNIERAGHAEIAAAEHAARLELKTFAGRLAIERAQVLLREQMTAGTEAAVFRAFVESLEESRN